MNKKIILVSAIILAMVVGLAAAFAQQAGPGRGVGHRFGHDGWMLKKMTKELNLTEAQQTQVKSILQAERAKMQPLMQQMHANELARNQAVTENFNEADARAFAGKQTQLQADLIVEKERTKSQIYALLTPEQRQKAMQLLQQREQNRQERMQKHSQKQQAPANQ
ncbi:MAG TPA: Spy/CpxP family protein refolding chaperone [Candidatus Limnocylindrales bacterium]|nr:Spy/CpxP family protein refolding chaperone [Candidatus Limnocylindrales bacterium]